MGRTSIGRDQYRDQYIEFGIAKERYAIRIEDIHEIIKMQTITETPTSRPFVKGVIHLRGKIVPVVSLRVLFGFPEAEYDKATRIIVVRYGKETVGIIVDRVTKVTTFEEIDSPPARIGALEGNLFTGIGVSGDALVGILKIDEVLLM